jgi:SpoVK/Ycf46/Vps4 family AAA+-type ATPase
VVATANNVKQLPPELSRKGRFDDIFFVSLPEASERRETFAIHLRKRKLDPEKFNLDAFAKATDKWSNSECEDAIKTALIFAWNDGGKNAKLTNEHIMQAIKESIPLSMTSAEEIKSLYEWVGWDEEKKDGIRARYASKARKELASKNKDNKLLFVEGNK